jgi:tyrosyl-tRNA synthetase
MRIITDEKKIDEILNRGIIVDILPQKEELKKLLISGRRLKIYIGFDATGDTLHLSHAKNIMLLEEFRKLGHETILLFGDFTARIGDPSGQEGTRSVVSKKQIKKNIKEWKRQIKNLMNFKDRRNPPKILFNSKWLSKIKTEDFLDLASKVTVAQMIERDMFQKRIKNGKEIFLHEFMYPLMQGYDSVAMDVDVELCGTDQIFNALMGRTLLKKIKNKNKFVVAVNLMENPETGELMSKSRGNGVFLNFPPEKMYGAIMSQPDEMTKIFFINCTKLSLVEIDKIIKENSAIDAKKIASFEIVKLIFNEKTAQEAEEDWILKFQKREIPENLEKIQKKEAKNLMDLLIDNNIVKSKSIYRRLVKEGAVLNLESKEKIIDPNFIPKVGEKFKIGKKIFIEII